MEMEREDYRAVFFLKTELWTVEHYISSTHIMMLNIFFERNSKKGKSCFLKALCLDPPTYLLRFLLMMASFRERWNGKKRSSDSTDHFPALS